MVAELERAGAIRSELVRQAFLAVPREQFLPDVVARDGLKAIYRTEAAIPTVTDSRGILISSSSATAIMAPMLEALDLQPGARVLEVGAGTGYNAALLKHIVGDRGRVTSVELDAAIARRSRRALAEGGHKVRVVVGDGRAGWPSGAPFDRIMVTASSDQVSQSWRDQLKEGGLVELPLHVAATLGLHSVVTFRRVGALLCSTDVIPGAFMPLRSSGEAAARPEHAPGSVGGGHRGRATRHTRLA